MHHFIIAYRISSIKDADLILVMDKGRIIEQGSHEELMKRAAIMPKPSTASTEKYRKSCYLKILQ